ncbi:MAG: F0F1 ATP synthase subunit B [Ostreibacterium sp.]
MNINFTLIGQLFSFGLFVWFCMKYVWPPIIATLEARQDKIAKGLAVAEEAKISLAQAQQHSENATKIAKQKSIEIITEAETRAKMMIETAKGEARIEGTRQLTVAKAKIEQETQRAKEELRTTLSALVLNGVSQIVEKEIDDKKHAQLINELAKQL